MNDFQPTSTSNAALSGKMDSTTNGNKTSSDTDSQGPVASFKRYLPIVKWVGTSTKDFVVSGQFKRTIRSPIQFLNPRHLSFPQTFGDALTRLAKNWGFYKSNYAIITFICCVGWLISSPYSLGILAILGLLWWYVLKTSNSTIKIGESEYGPMQKYMFAGLATLISCLFFGIISTLVGGVSVGAGISSLHAICHIKPESEHEKLTNLNDIENENAMLSNTNNNINITSSSNNNNNNINYDGNTTSVNGLDIMQLSDVESFSVNDAEFDEAQQISNNNKNNNEVNDGSPELGIN